MITKDQRVHAFRNELWRQVHSLENSKTKRDRMLASVLCGLANNIVDIIEDPSDDLDWHDIDNTISDTIQRNWHSWRE